jgi:hypothetical protein
MNIERWTLCLAGGPGWARTLYPDSEGAPDAYFLRCVSCGYENHNGASVRPTGAGL